jgi:hypothetical protein
LGGNITSGLGTPPDFGGGVNNEYEFEEVVFINGTPLCLQAAARISA